MGRPLCHDQSVFGKVAPQSIDDLRTLPDQEIASAKHDCTRLLVLTLHGGKAHGGPLYRLAYRLRVGHVVLLPLDEGLCIGRRNQAYRVAQFANLASPVMCAGASFHSYQADGLPSKESQHLVSSKLFAENNIAIGICAMRLKNMFRQVQSNRANFAHGRFLSCGGSTPTILAHQCRRGGVHPIIMSDGVCVSVVPINGDLTQLVRTTVPRSVALA